MNLGVILEDQQIGGQTNFEIINPKGEWPAYFPEPQYSQDHLQDSMACVSYSATHCVESQTAFNGSITAYSERFLAKLSGTTPQGNTLVKVAQTIQQYGMVLNTDWPEPTDFTWESYYADIPPEIIAKGQEFLKKYKISYEFVAEQNVAEALKRSPLQCIITKETPYHAVEAINTQNFFDTYSPYIKPIESVYDYFAIVIKPKMTPLTDDQLNILYQLTFKRAIDPAGLATFHGKNFDEVSQLLLASNEFQYYRSVDVAVKQLENAVRSGQL